eukprot:610178-Pelagomonas_calceolata.AAC.5
MVQQVRFQGPCWSQDLAVDAPVTCCVQGLLTDLTLLCPSCMTCFHAGGYPYTPSAFPSIMADDKPKTKFPGWPVKYPGWPGSYPAPSGDAPPGAR